MNYNIKEESGLDVNITCDVWNDEVLLQISNLRKPAYRAVRPKFIHRFTQCKFKYNLPLVVGIITGCNSG